MRKGGDGESETDAGVTGRASTPAAVPPRADRRLFKPELTPTWLHLVTLLGGHRPPDFAGGFRAAYIGSGHGFTPAVTAAVHPEAEVLWWDPDVRAVESARHLRDAARLTNLTVHEQPAPPIDLAGPLDLLVVDGVLDAVSDDVRARLVEAAAGALRPGGIACITYRTMVGWVEVAPVHRLIQHLVARDPRPAVESIPDVKKTLRSLHSGGAQYLTQRPVVEAWLEQLLTMPLDDLIEEVMDHRLRPLSHAQVVDTVRPFGWVHAGPARASDLSQPPFDGPLAQIIAAAPSPVLRETLTDLAIRRTYRADVFRLGGAPFTPRALDRAIRSMRFTDPPPGSETDRPPTHSNGPTALGAIPDGEIAIDELADNAAGRRAALRDLLAAGLTHPLSPVSSVSAITAAAQRLTSALCRAPVPVAQRVLVAPALGSAISAALRPTSEQRDALGMK